MSDSKSDTPLDAVETRLIAKAAELEKEHPIVRGKAPMTAAEISAELMKAKKEMPRIYQADRWVVEEVLGEKAAAHGVTAAYRIEERRIGEGLKETGEYLWDAVANVAGRVVNAIESELQKPAPAGNQPTSAVKPSSDKTRTKS